MTETEVPDENQLEFPGMPERIEPPEPDPYFLEGRAESSARVKVDLSTLIFKNADRYAGVDMGGYQYWERPMVFLWDYLADDQPSYYGLAIEQLWDDFEFREHPPWTRDLFAALAAVCPVVAQLADAELSPQDQDTE